MTRRVRLRPLSLPPGLTVAVVAGIAGLMFVASAQLARGTEGTPRQPTDLAAFVDAESARLAHLAENVDGLRAEVDELTAAVPISAVEDEAAVRRERSRVGTLAVTGPGLRVQLDDAPPSNISISGVTVDDLVVHQQDIQHVINALWAGGAEAMTLQGERVTMTSAFRCSGNILLLHGKVFSPPYVVEVIGDADAMRAALDASPGVQRYLDWVATVGLGWNVRDADNLMLPAYTGSSDLRFAALPPGTDALR